MNRGSHKFVTAQLALAIFLIPVIAISLLFSPVDLTHAQSAMNAAPAFDAFRTTLTVEENTPVGRAVGAPLAATDPDGDSLYFALTGGHTDLFSIDSRTGQLRIKALLDYETRPEDDYWLHAAVRDSKGPRGERDLVADDVGLIVIEVQNADEPGTVTLSWSQPQVGAALTATLEDEDGDTSGLSWRWAQSTSKKGAYTDISGATSATYTPAASDANRYLRVAVAYSDPEGSGKTAQTTTGPVRSAPQNDNAPQFSEGESTTRNILENTLPGSNVGSRLRATNTDNQELRYTLNNEHFSTDPKTGQIRTKTSPDYEAATSHSVQVTVADPFGDSDTIDVTINVIDQPVEILGPSQVDYSEDPFYRTDPVAQYTLVPSSATPTLTGPDARLFSFETYAGLTFKEDPDYETPRDSGRNNVYNVTINAVDGNHSTTKNVAVRVTNHNEGPVITGPEAVEFTEQTTGPVARYSARDPENDPIRWAVQDTDDWSYFKISQSGVLTFREPPDFETMEKDAFEVVILAQSGMNMATDGMRVYVTVVDGADPPFFHRGYSDPLTVPENTSRDTPVGEPVSATGGAGSVLTYTLKGTDARHFSIDPATGQLKTKTALNYEARNSYSVTVRASDGSLATDAAITISVVNEDEEGTVTLSTSNPRARTPLTARLTDPDGGVTGVTWQWATSTDQSSWTDIYGANSQTLSPEDAEVNTYLRATASYTDGQGPGKTAHGQSANAVGTGPNRSPSSLDSGTTVSRTVAENTAAGTEIGAPITTTDPDNDVLTYALAGRDASSFSIVTATGQLKTKAALNYERKNSYTLAVRARDPFNSYANIPINISVTDVDEEGTVTLSTSQPRVGAAVTATLNDPDGPLSNTTWQWKLADNGTGTGRDISGAASRSYTPVAGDLGKFLQVTVAYTDSFGTGKTAQSDPLQVGNARVPRNTGGGTNNPGNNSPGNNGGGGLNQPPNNGPKTTTSQAVSVTYGSTSYRVNEGGAAQVTVRLSAEAPFALRVPVTVSRGTAESGDYRVFGLPDGALNFSKGSRSRSFIVSALQDDDADDETLNLGIGPLPQGISLGSNRRVTFTIQDDDVATMAISYASASYRVNEGAATQVTVTLSAGAPSALQVPVTVSRGTAESGDYRVSGLSGGFLNFSQGSRSKSFIITALQDDDADDETLNLGFGTLPQGISMGSTTRVTVIIQDDDVATMAVSYASSTYRVNEGAAAQVTVRLSAGAPVALQVPVTVSRGTAESGDYRVSGLSRGALNFSQGSRTRSFIITALQDDDADDEDLNLTFGTLPQGISLGSTPRATLIIQDNDKDSVAVSYASASYRVNEGGAAQVTVRLSAGAPGALQVPVTVGRGTAERGDYRVSGLSGSTLHFSQGSRSRSFIITARQDDDADDETLNLGFGTLPSSVTTGSTSGAILTINDDDAPHPNSLAYISVLRGMRSPRAAPSELR